MSKHVLSATGLAILAASLAGCMGDSEAVGRAKELNRRLGEYQQRIQVLEEERKTLEDENRRLQAELAAATKGGSLNFDEQQRVLDNRAAALELKERGIAERERTVQERENDLALREKEFHQATNLSMADIGEARRIKQDYDRMVQERNQAQRTADNWLKVAWGSWAAFLLITSAVAYAALRYYYRDRAHQREADFHREKARLARELVATEVRDEKARVVLQVLDGLSGNSAPPTVAATDIRRLPADKQPGEEEDE